MLLGTRALRALALRVACVFLINLSHLARNTGNRRQFSVQRGSMSPVAASAVRPGWENYEPRLIE
jgi:hypothetical protein